MSGTTQRGVCCSLPEPAQRARGAALRAGVLSQVAEVRELDDGYALRFAPTAEVIEGLGRFIAFEQACCGFLRFALEVEAAGGPVWLSLSGSAEAKDFVRAALQRWSA